MFSVFDSVVDKNKSVYDSYRYWALFFAAANKCEYNMLFKTLLEKLDIPAKEHQFIFVSLLCIFIMKISYKSVLVFFIMADNSRV